MLPSEIQKQQLRAKIVLKGNVTDKTKKELTKPQELNQEPDRNNKAVQRYSNTELTRGTGWAVSGRGQVLVQSSREPVCASVTPVPLPQWIHVPLSPLPHSELTCHCKRPTPKHASLSMM